MMTHGPYFFIMKRDPECPYCRQILLPPSVRFIDATAFCQNCADLLDVRTVRQIISTQYDDLTKGAWSYARGLLWFTPHACFPSNYAAHFLPAVVASKERLNDQPRDDGVA